MQTQTGRYRLVRHLASGGMGEVYLAEAPGAAGFVKRVVVKTLRQELASDAELTRQFADEGRLLEALDHPNIAAILDLGQDGDSYFLAMEYVEGFDLRALLRALPVGTHGQVLSEPAVLEIVRAVAHALDHAQNRRGADGRTLGIVHHDVTPSNVMVRRDGHVKLVDFGVARTAMVARLSPGALRGKLPYLSPEHARQERADGRSDLFALGLCALEWLSGERALDVGEPESLTEAYALLPAKVESLAGRVSAGTLQLLRELTALPREQRPGSAADVADRAGHLLAELAERSPARRLAAELAPAFDVLAARAGSFDQTLAQTIGMLAPSGPDFTGTLSLPGIELAQQAEASARSAQESGAVPAQPLARRGRLWPGLALALSVLVLVGLWWRTRTGDVAGQPATASGAAVVPASMTPASPRPASAIAAVPSDPALDQPPPTPGPAAGLPSAASPAEPAEPAAAAAVQPPQPASPAAAETAASPRGKESADSKSSQSWGVVEFRVLPASTVITVDGKRRAPTSGGDRYVLQLKAGKHTIVARDPEGGGPDQRAEVDVEAGAEVKLKGFSFVP